MPGRMRWMPSTTTVSPSLRPVATVALVGAAAWPSLTRCCTTLLWPSTT
jgi:hypothetical protein